MQLRIHLQTESAEGPQIPERNDSETVDGRFDEFYQILILVACQYFGSKGTE